MRHAVEHLDAYLSACQLGITMASLGLGAVGERALHDVIESTLGDVGLAGNVGVAGALAFGSITLAHVVAGELAPKSIAIARTGQAALAVAPTMRLFYVVTRPCVDVFNAIGNLLLRPFGIGEEAAVKVAQGPQSDMRQRAANACRPNRPPSTR